MRAQLTMLGDSLKPVGETRSEKYGPLATLILAGVLFLTTLAGAVDVNQLGLGDAASNIIQAIVYAVLVAGGWFWRHQS